jgi:hypothetical protein
MEKESKFITKMKFMMECLYKEKNKVLENINIQMDLSTKDNSETTQWMEKENWYGHVEMSMKANLETI